MGTPLFLFVEISLSITVETKVMNGTTMNSINLNKEGKNYIFLANFSNNWDENCNSNFKDIFL
jgi:hypothetical protein